MSAEPLVSVESCLGRIQELQVRLEESEDTLEAIRRGAIDAVVVHDGDQPRIYTLETADRPYRVLIERIGEGAVTLGQDATVFYCNLRLAEMLRTPQEQVIGRPLHAFLDPANHAALDRLMAEAARTGAREELSLRTPDGRQTPVLLSLSPLPREGEHDLLCGVLADLSEQRLHMEELSAANERLLAESAQRAAAEDALRQSQKMEAVGQLTGGLAHDFNNLLTGIVGSLQLMRTRIAQGRIEDLERYIGAALSSGDRAAALTHRLLAFARRQTLDPKVTEVNRLVAGMSELLGRTVGPAIAIETIADAEAGSVLCDPNQLENALLNLAINARDAMPEGGRLTIETSCTEIEPVFAAARDMEAGRYTCLAVSDTGTGMPPEVVARAFDPFFTTKPIGLGTGLGLSMIYGFAKQSGGQVRIHSVPKLGTTVRLFLPRLDSSGTEAGAAAHAGARHGAGRDKKTVLVVDDEPVVRMLVLEVLEDLGFSALEGATGAEGLRHVQSGACIDLLVSDVGLPGGMNGRQLADAARALRPGLKVLFITGFAETAALGQDAMEAGMEVITKPFSIDGFSTRVRAMIAG